MHFRQIAWCVLLAAGCAAETHPESIVLTAKAGDVVRLEGGSEADLLNLDALGIDWVTSESPTNEASILEEDGTSANLSANQQGRYAIDRWVRYESTSTWTHRYTIDVANAAPVAMITPPFPAPRRGVPAVIGGGDSSDTETLELQFRWVLKFRPLNSDAVLEDPTQTNVLFFPDESGTYELELDVFDGALWSETTATTSFEVL